MITLLALLQLAGAADLTKADVQVVLRLDRMEVAQDAPLTGTLTVRFSWPEGSPHRGEKRMRLNRPVISLFSPRILVQARITPPLPTEFEVDREYALTFVIRPCVFTPKNGPPFTLPFFNVGERMFSVDIVSPAPGWSSGFDADAYGCWKSNAIPITVTPPRGKTATRDDLLAALGTEPVKSVDRLFRHCEAMGYRDVIDELFSRPGMTPILSHDARRIWVSAAPGEPLELDVHPSKNPCVIGHPFTHVRAFNRPGSLKAPVDLPAGTHPIRCLVHDVPFGWLRVKPKGNR